MTSASAAGQVQGGDGGGELLGGLVADDLRAGEGEEGFGLVPLGGAGVADVEGVAQVVQHQDVGQAPGAGEAELLLQPVDGAVRVREDPPRLVVHGEPLPVARGGEGGFHPGGGAGERDRQVRVVVVEVGQVDRDDRGGGVEPRRRRPVEEVLRDGGQQAVERPPGGVPGGEDLLGGAGDPGGEVRVGGAQGGGDVGQDRGAAGGVQGLLEGEGDGGALVDGRERSRRISIRPSSSRSCAAFASTCGSMRLPSASTRADRRASETSRGLRRLPRPGPMLIADPP